MRSLLIKYSELIMNGVILGSVRDWRGCVGPMVFIIFLIRSGAVQNCHSRLSCATPLINTMQCGRRKGTRNPGRESILGVINF